MRLSLSIQLTSVAAFLLATSLSCGNEEEGSSSPTLGSGAAASPDPLAKTGGTLGAGLGSGGLSAGAGGMGGAGAESGGGAAPASGATSAGGVANGSGGSGSGASTGGAGTGGTSVGTPAELASCRGLVAASVEGGVYVSWRLQALDPKEISFNIYRDGELVNPVPIEDSTNLKDGDGTIMSTYEVRPVVGGIEQGSSESVSVLPDNYVSITVQNPEGKAGRLVGTGDLDGDCDFDFIVKLGDQDFDVTQYDMDSGGDTFTLEAYTNEGDLLWRREMGPNIRPGVWFSPMAIFDFDGDGKAELALKIGEISEELGGEGDLNGDGTTDYSDDLGNVPVHNATDTEFLEIWDGETGKTRARTAWIDVSPWGSDGNRYNRNMMVPAYLGGEGENPSIVITRGGNSRNEIHAYDLVGDQLVERWTWSIGNGGGNYGHNVRSGDIDGDGKDEFLFFARALDDDGSELWNTNQAHGDRFHLTDIDPTRPGLEIFYVQEFEDVYDSPVHARAAESGEYLWGPMGKSGDVGRGLSANITDDPGVESWSSEGTLYSSTGEDLGSAPSSVNMALWWDGDLYRELIDQNRITKHGVGGSLLSADGCGHGSRNIPMGYGDVMGDWREEAWWLCDDNTELRVYFSTDVTSHRIYSLMQDPIYRTSSAAMMSGYVQATQTGFYIGEEMEAPPTPYITIPPGQ